MSFRLASFLICHDKRVNKKVNLLFLHTKEKNMNDTITILCCTDDKYAPFYGIMLTSLFENNKEEAFDIYIITAGLSEETSRKYQLLASQKNSRIHVITINDEMMRKCPIREGDHVTLAAYYRIIAPLYLPDNLDKILYMDGDIIINGKINDLWNTDINDHAMGAIVDESYFRDEPYMRLRYDQSFPSINSGVLLINLNYWRKHDVISRCMNCIKIMADKLLFHDQDTLNVVLHNEIKLLPLTYNYQRGFIDYAFYNHFDNKYQEEINAVKYNPVVIHFTGYSKPWHEGCPHPYTPYFLYYWKKSLWNNMPLVSTKPSFKQRLLAIRNEIIWALGIKKRPRTYLIAKQTK